MDPRSFGVNPDCNGPGITWHESDENPPKRRRCVDGSLLSEVDAARVRHESDPTGVRLMNAPTVSSSVAAVPVERLFDWGLFVLTGAEAEVTATAKMDGQDQGGLEVRQGEFVAVHWVAHSGLCCVEKRDGRRGQVAGSCIRLKVMLNVALEGQADTFVRHAIEQVAVKFQLNLVADALREGRTYPHLTLKYDFVADGAQLAQLLVVLRGFAARHSCVALQLNRAWAFAPKVAFLDVAPQPAEETSQAGELLKALRDELETLTWLGRETKMPH